MRDLAIYGAGGLGKEICCIINQINRIKPTWNLLGYFDDGMEMGKSLPFGIVLGGINKLNEWETPISVVMAIGRPKVLYSVVEEVTNTNVNYPNIIAPNVLFYDADTVSMGRGNVVFPNTLISCNVRLGDFNIINVYSQIGHDSVLGDYNVLMPDVNISGGVVVGNTNLFGLKSAVLQYKKVGNEVVLSPGAILSRSGEDGKMYVGNPAKVFM